MADKTYLRDLLELAQNGDEVALDTFLAQIRDSEMNKRIGRYLHKNRQVEDDDLRQEFLIGCALNIYRAKLDVGDPVEYVMAQGVFRVRGYLRKHIMTNVTQICHKCGNESRMNRINGRYVCKKCGSTDVETREIADHDEMAMMNVTYEESDYNKIEEEMSSNDIIDKIRDFLNVGTNVYRLFSAIVDDNIDPTNPEIKNYISEIAKQWGTSQTVVVQTKKKLAERIVKFCKEYGYSIKDNHFEASK